MSRVARLTVIAALALGVVLVGLELMITAVALPQILNSLTDWTDLRHASWIINGYLVAYVAVMPLAGRAADRYSLAVLYGVCLITFAAGSLLAGTAQSLDWLIAARVVQGAGAGAVFPLAIAAAGHLFAGRARARAIGLVSAFNFLGMAGGPFIGAAVLTVFNFGTADVVAGNLAVPPWRWVFYLCVPFALLAVVYTWATAKFWPRPEDGHQSLDLTGAALFTGAVALILAAIATAGSEEAWISGAIAVAGIICLTSAALWFRRSTSPFLDLQVLRDRTVGGALLMSLLTGYSFATAVIGAAVFVDRVRFAGPDEQQLALGSLALATALGALVSGWLVRPLGIVVASVIGLIAEIAGLLLVASLRPESDFALLCAGLALFGAGFGLTVTARTTGALEAIGRQAFGVASAALTVARMVGMAVGVAVLTALGSNRIEALSVVMTDQAARDAVLPPALQGRPLQDYLVVDALERWAAGQAADILSVLFLVAALVAAIAIVPTLAMRNRPAA